eukprot:SAG31_NODE_14156_length_824_cov_1.303448_1_plen_97_part_10
MAMPPFQLLLVAPMLAIGTGETFGVGSAGRPTCLPGQMGGGTAYAANFTVRNAVAWCQNSTRCAGFTAPSAFPSGCNNSAAILLCNFKDHYGAVRRN